MADIKGLPRQWGKTVTGDVTSGKATLPLAFALGPRP